jgi:uncharacterized protein
MNALAFCLIRYWIFAMLFLAAACTVLPAQKDTTQFFILTSRPGSVSSDPAHGAGRELSIGLGPIDFPGYLKRREIVTQVGSSQVQLSDNKRWAESLDSNFQRVLGQDLATQLGTQRVVLFPWYGRPDIDYQVEVQVHRFDTDSDNRSHLDARWIIKDARTGRELMAQESSFSSTVTANDTVGSEALSGDLNSLSATITQSLMGIAERLNTASKSRNLSG